MMQPMRDERRGRKPELLRAQQSRNHHIAARLQLAVGLDFDTSAQIIQQQAPAAFQPVQAPRAARRA